MKSSRRGYCVYIDTVVDGSVPAVRDERGLPCWYATRIEAQREIAENMMMRLQEFMDGEREFEDAMTVEEYVVEVEVLEDGSVRAVRAEPMHGSAWALSAWALGGEGGGARRTDA